MFRTADGDVVYRIIISPVEPTMLTIHHLNNSRSQRILWMLEELGVPYTLKRYERDPKTMLAPDSLKKIHPLGKSPVLTDGDKTLAESGAIIDYLAHTYGPQLLPAADSPAYLQYQYWLHYAEGSLMPYLMLKLVFDTIQGSPMPFFIKPIVKSIATEVHKSFLGPNLTGSFTFIEQHLSQQAWFAGENLTAADIQMSFPLEAGASRLDLSAYPHIRAYIAKTQARPAYQKALAVGGPYAYA
jgi:glutathione S-transferase